MAQFKDVLKSRRKELRLTQEQIAVQLGLTKQMISLYESGKSLPKIDVYEKLCKQLSINIAALDKQHVPVGLQSEARPIGQPTLTETSSEDFPDAKFVDIGDGRYHMIVPLVDEYARAGYLAGYADATYMERLPKHSIIVDKYHKGRYMAFEVTGDSMDDDSKRSVPHGSIITCRQINQELWKSKLHIHKFPYFVIVTKTDGIAVKQVIEHDVKGHKLICKSLNPDKASYPDPVYDLADVAELYNVVDINVKPNLL